MSKIVKTFRVTYFRSIISRIKVKPKINYISVIMIYLMLNACSEAIVMHNSNGKVSFSTLKDLPPGEVSDTNLLYRIPNPWELQAMAISPIGEYGALALFSTEGAKKDWKGVIRLYSTLNKSFIKEYNKANLISMMEYPIKNASMYFSRLDWINERELLVHCQPQTTSVEMLPLNVSLVINVITDTVIDLQYSERSDPFAIQAPVHPSGNLYPSEIRENKLYINGSLVANFPNLSKYDIFFRGN